MNSKNGEEMASLFMRFPEGRIKTLTLSYDDGVEQDRKLIEIMNKYGLKGTFNLNSGEYAEEGHVYPVGTIHRRMSRSMVTDTYKNSGHEVAVHGLTHPWLEQLPKNVCVKEICEDRANLETQFGGVVRGMAYPFGTYNDAVVEILRENGIAYSRTVHSTGQFRMPEDWLRLPATCHHDDPKLMEYAKQFLEGNSYGSPWMFYLWGHSYEFEQNNNWNVIEKFAEYMGGREEIWYATNIQIYNYCKAFEQLRFNTGMTYAENPTSTDLFFDYGQKLYQVAAGEKISF